MKDQPSPTSQDVSWEHWAGNVEHWYDNNPTWDGGGGVGTRWNLAGKTKPCSDAWLVRVVWSLSSHARMALKIPDRHTHIHTHAESVVSSYLCECVFFFLPLRCCLVDADMNWFFIFLASHEWWGVGGGPSALRPTGGSALTFTNTKDAAINTHLEAWWDHSRTHTCSHARTHTHLHTNIVSLRGTNEERAQTNKQTTDKQTKTKQENTRISLIQILHVIFCIN